MLKGGTSWENRERLTYSAVILGLGLAQTVTCWLVTGDSRAQCQGRPLWIYGGQSGTETGFSTIPSISRYYYSTDARYSVTDAIRN
jgi:hypothetical protein